jgi:hypothetical protein
MGWVMGIEGFFIDQVGKMCAPALEEKGIQGLTRNPGDPAEVIQSIAKFKKIEMKEFPMRHLKIRSSRTALLHQISDEKL